MIESHNQTALPGDPPLLPGELLSYIGQYLLPICFSIYIDHFFYLMTEHKITYLDNFLGGIEGSVFITSYKMYFKSEQNPDNSVCLTYMYMYIHIHKNIHILYMYNIHVKTLHTYMYVHKYTHTYIHTYIYTYIHTYIHTYMHTYMYMHTYIHTHSLIGAYISCYCFIMEFLNYTYLIRQSFKSIISHFNSLTISLLLYSFFRKTALF